MKRAALWAGVVACSAGFGAVACSFGYSRYQCEYSLTFCDWRPILLVGFAAATLLLILLLEMDCGGESGLALPAQIKAPAVPSAKHYQPVPFA